MQNMETPLSKALEYLLRKTKGATQKKLAEAIGISQPYISDLKYGKREGTPETWVAIANFFGREYSEFCSLGENVLLATTVATPFEQKNQVKNKDLADSLNKLLAQIEEYGREELLRTQGRLEEILINLKKKQNQQNQQNPP